MTSTPQKLPLRADTSFFKEATKVRSPFFLLYWRENKEQTIRFAITVPKTTAPLSSQRNKIKRKIKPVFHSKLSQFSSGDFFVVGFSKVLQLNFSELANEVEKILTRAIERK